jgi:hypothetical protein
MLETKSGEAKKHWYTKNGELIFQKRQMFAIEKCIAQDTLLPHEQ